MNHFAIYRRSAKQAEKHWRALESDTKSHAALSRIAVLMESGILTKSEIISFINRVELGVKPDLSNPVVICFGLCIDDVLESDEIQDSEFASVFELIDYLKTDLSSEIETKLNCRFEVVEDAYNGETLSVRYALWDVDLDKIDELNLKWWEILEVRSHKEIYDDSMLGD